MSDVVRLRTRVETEEAAAVWAWRIDSGAMDAAGQAAFEAWLRLDLRHRRAYDELAGVWQALGVLGGSGQPAQHVPAPRLPHRWRRAGWWAAAVAVFALSAAALAFLQRVADTDDGRGSTPQRHADRSATPHP